MKRTIASKKLQMKAGCQPSRDCLALNGELETRNAGFNLGFVTCSNLSSDDPGWKMWGRTNVFFNLVNPTRSETDSKPPAALVSIEIRSFGDWKCCKAYFFFFSEIMVWFYCSALSGPFACSFPLRGSSAVRGWSSSHPAALPTAPARGSHHTVSFPCPRRAGAGQTQLLPPQHRQPWSILLSQRQFGTAAKCLLLLPSLSPAPSICSTRFILPLLKTFKCC